MSLQTSPIPAASVFDTSMAYRPHAETVKKQLFKKAIEQVAQWDTNQPGWKLSKLAKTLANETFKEFSDTMGGVFNQPNYEFWLKSSIDAEKLVFIPELIEQIYSKIPIRDE